MIFTDIISETTGGFNGGGGYKKMTNDYKTVKLSPLGLATLVLTAAFLAFLLGWFFRGLGGGEAVRVRTENMTGVVETQALPTPTPAEGTETAEKIDINTADAALLQTLPGIGEKRAADIVAYREEHGPFRIVEQLTDVPGIGEGTLAGLIDYVTVTENAGGAQ